MVEPAREVEDELALGEPDRALELFLGGLALDAIVKILADRPLDEKALGSDVTHLAQKPVLGRLERSRRAVEVELEAPAQGLEVSEEQAQKRALARARRAE